MPSGFGLYTEELRNGACGMQTGMECDADLQKVISCDAYRIIK